MADEEHKEPYHPDQDTIDMPGITERDKQCFVCDQFYLGRHTGENPHKVVRGNSTGRCPDCEAKFQQRARELGDVRKAMSEEAEQTDSAHARAARYYANESPEAKAERLRQSEEREREEQAQKDSEGQ